jgi:hypothetical protein
MRVRRPLPPSRPLVLALTMIALPLAGCRSQRSLRWELAFDEPADRTHAAVVVAEIRQGTCATEGELLYRADGAPGAETPRVPTLGGGPHSFAAVARDAACVIIARGCIDAVLPTEPGTVVRTALAHVAPGAPICSSCIVGRCATDRDGGSPPGPEDGGVDGGPIGPPAPELVYPWNGYATGSWRAPASLRPRLMWRASDGATAHELAIDRRCAPGVPSACAFDTAETTTIPVTAGRLQNYVPTASILGVGEGGARVHWRVRGCDASGCGAWSAVRWLDVGRDRHDIDGDGYGDLVVGAPREGRGGTDRGSAYLFRGSSIGLGATGTAITPHTEDDAWLGNAIALGDLDGDGLADAVIGIEESDVGAATDAGRIAIVPGSGSGALGLDLGRAIVVDAPEPGVAGYFGQSIAIVDDVDSDGFRDLLVGAPRTGSVGRAYLFRGGPALLAGGPPQVIVDPDASTTARFGFAVAPAGDVDGDGGADFSISAPWADDGGLSAVGRVWLHHGGSPSIAQSIAHPSPDAASYFGFAIAGIDDADHDGYADLAIGAPYDDRGDASDSDRGAVFVLWGAGPSGVAYTGEPPPHTASFSDVHAGWSLAPGDFGGDGEPDLAIGHPAIDFATGGTTDTGRVGILSGDGTRSLAREDYVLARVEQMGVEFGRSIAAIDVDGDGSDELIVGAHRFDGTTPDEGRVWWIDDPIAAPDERHVLTAPSGGSFGYALPGSIGRLTAPDG